MKFFILCLSSILLFTNSIFAQDEWNYDTLKVGGIGQVIATKGNKQGPLILFLHGGPGSSRMKQADLFSNKLQNDFLVVQWDQRESGRTLALNATKGPVSLEMMVRDTHDLIDTLLKKFQKPKLYLAGESWGTVLGFKIAETYPRSLYAYMAFSPVTDQVKSEKMLLSKLLDDAKNKGNINAERELRGVNIPFSNYKEIYYLRKWWFNYDGHPFADKDTALLRDYVKSWSDTWLPTWQAAMKRNLFAALPALKCPVYFFIGGKDYQTNCELAKDYYNMLRAPEKKIYWFDNAGHDLLVTEASDVQRIIINDVMRK